MGTTSKRFSSRRMGGASAPDSPAQPSLVRRLLRHFATIGSRPDGQAQLVENEAAVLITLRSAAELGFWLAAVPLLKVSESAFARSGRWGAWSQVLELALQAGRELGDRSLLAWAHHELGVRSRLLDDLDSARAHFSRALALREAAGEHEAAEVTRSQLESRQES